MTASAKCPYCGGPGTAEGPDGHEATCPAVTLSRGSAHADRLSAAREGVVKALEELVADFPDVSEPVAVMWKAIQVTLSAENYTAARAALKEYEEASN